MARGLQPALRGGWRVSGKAENHPVHSHRRDAGAEGGTHDPFFEDVCGSLWRGCNRWAHGFLSLARINAGGHV
jgi:hypothetical protein